MVKTTNRILAYLSQLLVGILLIALCVSFFRLYRTEGVTPATVSVLSTIVLVIITAWYARSTYRLLQITGVQTEATKAGYAPKLDGEIDWAKNEIQLSLCNRGLGVAKDIQIQVCIFTTQQGLEEVGESYRYFGYVQQSLQPGKMLASNPSEYVFKFTPKFFTSLSEKSIATYRDLAKKGKKSNFSHDVSIEPGTINYLIDRIEEGGGGKEHLPSERKTLGDIVAKYKDGLDDNSYPIVHVNVVYKDVIGDREYVEKIVEGERINFLIDDIDSDANYFKYISTASGLRLAVARKLLEIGAKIGSPNDIAHPFEEDLSGEVKSQAPNEESTDLLIQ